MIIRYVKPVQVQSNGAAGEITLSNAVRSLVANDRRFTSSDIGIFAASRIFTACNMFDQAVELWAKASEEAAQRYTERMLAYTEQRQAWDAARIRHTNETAAYEAGMAEYDKAGSNCSPPLLPSELPPEPEEPAKPALHPPELEIATTPDGQLLKEAAANPSDGYQFKPPFALHDHLVAIRTAE